MLAMSKRKIKMPQSGQMHVIVDNIGKLFSDAS